MAVSRNSRVYCGVSNCKTYYSSNENVSFHLFPKENESKVLWINESGQEEFVDRRSKWITNLRMGKEALKKTQLRVCSLHFTEDDFMPPGAKIKRKRLKCTAIPSVNLPKPLIPSRSKKKRSSKKKLISRKKHLIKNKSSDDSTSIEISDKNNISKCFTEIVDEYEENKSSETVDDPFKQIDDQYSEETNIQETADNLFDWNKYLLVRDADEVPEDFFLHVCKSELNGIEVGSIVEIENEDQNGYWFASVCSSKGVLINLHYLGDENDKHDFWLEVKSSRIHALNWGSENNKKLLPPHPDRFSRVNPKIIKEKVQDSENIVSNSVLKLKGAPIYNIFKTGMFVEVQDKDFPYRVWISKILKNVGGRLFLKMEGTSSPESKPFWLFYLNERIFPFGWAEQKGLPWRVMNLDTKFEDTMDSMVLLNVLKPKTPEQHSYKVGEMLEIVNPYSLMVFYVATIIKIYDNRYFKVEVNNDDDLDKRISFVSTKENPYLFKAGWATEHGFLLKPPSDWIAPDTFCWSKYVSMKNSNLANVESKCRRSIDHVQVGMKLEAVDPMDLNQIRVATVEGFSDHWMFLSFDRTLWSHKLLHVRSVYSDDIFPVGWCNKHKYLLSTPKLPFTDCNDYAHCYYMSDVDVDSNILDNDVLKKSSDYIKGDIFYHSIKKNDQLFENILNDSCDNNSDVSKSESKTKNVIKPLVGVKTEIPKSKEELHDSVLQNEKELEKKKDEKELEKEPEKEKDEKELEKEPEKEKDEKELKKEKDEKELEKEKVEKMIEIEKKKEKELVIHTIKEKIKKLVNHAKKKKVVSKRKISYEMKEEEGVDIYTVKRKKVDSRKKEEIMPTTSLKMFDKNIYDMCVYFNKGCYSGNRFKKRKRFNLPDVIGPGPVSKILKKAITIFVSSDHYPEIALKRLKTIQNMLFNGPGGVIREVSVGYYPYRSRQKSICSENFLLPESKKMAQAYCSTLCSISGMCENFMTTEKTLCSHCKKEELENTNSKISKSSDLSNCFEKSLTLTEEVSKVLDACIHHEDPHKNNLITVSIDSERHLSLIKTISKVADTDLDWNNKALVKRYQHYLVLIKYYEALVTRLDQYYTPLEIAIINEIEFKTYNLFKMDEMDIYSNTKSEISETNDIEIFDNSWKLTFENYYRNDIRFKKYQVDIGHFKTIEISSNPKYWSSEDVFNYLKNDMYCIDIAKKFINEDIDGFAFMQLNEEQLLEILECKINLVIRIMCHVSEVKFHTLSHYCDI